ncbi:MAG: glycosyltransferase family 2 protein [Symploca sp. SIO2G7]|nr:glycosyltransferase family 2 protein [Symploca sp. SIO2G7]
MTINFTVAIPTYNSAERLSGLLDKLLEQTTSQDFVWQLIVVDNNSTDITAEIIKAYQVKYQDKCTLIYALETQQGAAFARQKAIQLAQSELVGFLDDDVTPADDWVKSAYEFGIKHPQAGAYGGRIIGKFEVPPPDNFQRIQSFLALRDRGDSSHLYNPENLTLPPAAAWVIRKKAWIDNVPLTPNLGGRTSKSMVQGDDYEPLLYIHKAGWEIWYYPGMFAEHSIPARRLQEEYLIALSCGCGLCIFQLRLITAKSWEKPTIFSRVMLGGLKRASQHFWKYRREIKTDIVARCELVFFISWFASPFYYYDRRLRSTL